MRAWRDGLPPEARRAAGAAAAEHLARLEPYRRARSLLSYWATGSELPTGALVAAALEAGKAVFLPRVSLADRRLVPRRVTDPSTQLAPGYRGLLEPDPDRTPEGRPDDLDLVVVPGLAFDRDGGRLGYGEGYFDRFLAGLPVRVWRLALAYAGQVVERVPTDPWDVRVHVIVTEEGPIFCGEPPRAP